MYSRRVSNDSSGLIVSFIVMGSKTFAASAGSVLSVLGSFGMTFVHTSYPPSSEIYPSGILSGSLLYEVRYYRSCKLFKFCLVFVWVGNQKGLLFDQQQVLLQITYAVQSRLWCRHLKFNLKLNIQGSRLWNHKSSISFSFSHFISPKSTLSQPVKTVFWTVPQNLIQDTTTRALQ